MSDGDDRGNARIWTVAHGAIAKYAAEAIALLCSFVTGVVTARNLGPGGKGDLAAMGYLAVLFGTAASLGLGEWGSHAVLARGRAMADAVRTAMTLLALSTALACVAYAAAAALQLGFDRGLTTAIVITGASVPAIAVIGVLSPLVDARHRFAVTAASRVTSAATTAVLSVVLVTITRRGIDGAAFAALIGWWVVPVVLVRPIAAEDAVSMPSFDRTTMSTALRFGAPVQVSQLLMTATARVDLLVVYAIADDAMAGHYSVALTLGSLNTFAALAIASATFGRVATSPADQVRSYLGFTARVAIIVSVVVGAMLAPLLPHLVARAFGHGFHDAVAPACVLLIGGVLWSAQWCICRGAAARGYPSVLVASYASSLITMLLADFALVPALESMGAALASVASSAVGLMVALVASRRQIGARLGDLVPRRSDFASLRSSLVRR